MLTKDKVEKMGFKPDTIPFTDDGDVDWQKDYKRIVVHNGYIQSKLPYAKMIPQCIDLDWFTFNRNYTKEQTVLMVAARIEGKKGIKEVAQACKELGYKFILVGRISKRPYFEEIMKVNPDTDFRENVPEEGLRQAYYDAAVVVINSVDGFESGPLIILEAMATGVPTLTRSVGSIPDLYNGENMVIRSGDTGDYDDLRDQLRELMENPVLRNRIRGKGWQTVKDRPAYKMARMFSNLYYDIMGEKQALVSVIIPTYDKPDVLVECMARAVTQDYINKEIIIVDSGNESIEDVVNEFKENTKVPIKYIRFENNGEYTLPKARNLGVIEAQGTFLLFCDNRVGMENTAISAFVDKYKEGAWLFGPKDGVEKGFVENFSFVKREDVINAGMFNERIDCYGGQSQEIRTRFSKHGILFERVDSAKAIMLTGSKNKYNKRGEIIRAKNILWKLYS